uniref:Uncharacterized protein n=1 Tax=Arundo donax TaxID=35708 RepID=A0A0A9CCF6_ARUDO
MIMPSMNCFIDIVTTA